MAPQETSRPRLTRRFEDALAFAHQLHADQVRKGTTVPYVAHPLAVCALVTGVHRGNIARLLAGTERRLGAPR